VPISLPIILLSPDSLESLYKLFAFLRNNRHTSSSKLAQWCFLVSLVMLVHHLFVTYPNVSIGNYCAVFCVHLSNFGWISRLQCFVLFLCYYSSPAKNTRRSNASESDSLFLGVGSGANTSIFGPCAIYNRSMQHMYQLCSESTALSVEHVKTALVGLTRTDNLK